MESENVEQLDMETSSVMNEIINPRLRENKRIQGLVLGYVQSGKTSNMAELLQRQQIVDISLLLYLLD